MWRYVHQRRHGADTGGSLLVFRGEVANKGVVRRPRDHDLQHPDERRLSNLSVESVVTAPTRGKSYGFPVIVRGTTP